MCIRDSRYAVAQETSGSTLALSSSRSLGRPTAPLLPLSVQLTPQCQVDQNVSLDWSMEKRVRSARTPPLSARPQA
eukprot:7150102-Alexandrium_andersonii.AAC.1